MSKKCWKQILILLDKSWLIVDRLLHFDINFYSMTYPIIFLSLSDGLLYLSCFRNCLDPHLLQQVFVWLQHLFQRIHSTFGIHSSILKIVANGSFGWSILKLCVISNMFTIQCPILLPSFECIHISPIHSVLRHHQVSKLISSTLYALFPPPSSLYLVRVWNRDIPTCMTS